MDRKAQATLPQRRSSTKSRVSSTEGVEFFNLLTSPELLQMTEALLPEHRGRLYPPTVTLSMFMRQVLEADGACQKAVNGWGSAACGRWFECLQRSHRWLLQSSPAVAAGGGQCAHAPNRPTAQPEGAEPMAVARSCGQAGVGAGANVLSFGRFQNAEVIAAVLA